MKFGSIEPGDRDNRETEVNPATDRLKINREVQKLHTNIQSRLAIIENEKNPMQNLKNKNRLENQEIVESTKKSDKWRRGVARGL